MAVLGDQPDAGIGHRPGSPRRDGDAIDLDAALVEVEEAAEHVGELGLSVALDAGDTDDLAGVDLEREPIEHPPSVQRRDGIGDPQRRCGHRCRRGDRFDRGCRLLDDPEGERLVAQRHRPTDHRLGQRAGVGVVRGHRPDDATAAQDRHDVGGVEDLVELVADEGDRLVLRRDGHPEHGEQLLGLERGEHRRRLVEDDDARIAAQALDDLDALAHPGGEIADERIGIESEPISLADADDEVARRLPVEPAAFTEGDVLPHEELVDEAEVLVHHSDAQRGRSLRIGDVLLAAVDRDRAAIGRDEPDEDAHQGRLAGAVLAEHAVHLAAVEVEVDAVAGDDVAEVLGDPADRDGRRRPVGHADRPRRDLRHLLMPW